MYKFILIYTLFLSIFLTGCHEHERYNTYINDPVIQQMVINKQVNNQTGTTQVVSGMTKCDFIYLGNKNLYSNDLYVAILIRESELTPEYFNKTKNLTDVDLIAVKPWTVIDGANKKIKERCDKVDGLRTLNTAKAEVNNKK